MGSVIIILLLVLAGIIITIYSIFNAINSLGKTKYDKYQIKSFIYLIIGCIILVVFASKYFNNKYQIETYNSVADGYHIESYKIVMDVNEKESIDIKEYITIYFYEGGHHGIYRFIPEWLKYTNKDGVTESRKAKIKNLDAPNDEYTIETVKGKQKIKIGDPNITLPIGSYTYEIDYTYDMGVDPYEKYDEFIFHAFGDYWGTYINNATVIINMPKPLDLGKENINFFSDKYRTKNINSDINYSINGNTITINLLKNNYLDSSLTIDIELPEGYFDKGSNLYSSTSFILCLICIALAVITFLIWLKNGKDLDKIPETVEFYPPENLDAAEIGYLSKSDTGRKLSIALIVELASKGYIKIVESENKTLRKIIKNTTDTEEFKEKAPLTTNEGLVYNRLFTGNNDTTILSSNTEFYKVFTEVSDSVKAKYDDIINDLKASKYMKTTSKLFVLGNILWIISFSVIEDLNPKLKILYLIALLANISIFILTLLMKRKNSYGEQLTAKIRGFKNYIEVAEKNQLEMLVEENPNYFYDILPYAYVLGISKKWIEKFEDIPIPANDMGNFNYCDTNSIDDLSDSVSYPTSSSSSGGCSSCGGGCSSCGGGCSSCGGGGSW